MTKPDIDRKEIKYDTKSRTYSDGKYLYVSRSELKRLGLTTWAKRHLGEPLRVKIATLNCDPYSDGVMCLFRRARVRDLLSGSYLEERLVPRYEVAA
ncbi:MAG: hypothetical protein IT384_22990 [Deltaproteobacteria bacterium]|nr:hypothetical protein [Deltaproteobacteria bacterium]